MLLDKNRDLLPIRPPTLEVKAELTLPDYFLPNPPIIYAPERTDTCYISKDPARELFMSVTYSSWYFNNLH